MKAEVADQEFVKLNKESIARLIETQFIEESGRAHSPRRRVPRWPFPGHVQLWVRDADGEESQILGTCHNLNENGMGFYCERPFDVGLRLPIAVHQPEATFHGDGVVRHCTPSGGEYFIGVEFAEDEAS